jgi:hypothetical protein
MTNNAGTAGFSDSPYGKATSYLPVIGSSRPASG